jgi:hypothetical protein
MVSEFSFYAAGHIGAVAFIGRFLAVWAVLYLILFLGSRRKAVQGILFAAAALALWFGTGLMLDGWRSWSSEQSFVPFGTRVWAWAAIAALPLCMAAFRGHKGLIPVGTALAYAIALPWCHRVWTDSYNSANGVHYAFVRNGPNFAAHVLVAAFAVFICWWGVRQASRALVNLGIAGFAVAVGWFYFSNIFDKAGRALGLIGLGVLFLAGGWALEKTRRKLLAGMEPKEVSTQEAK